MIRSIDSAQGSSRLARLRAVAIGLGLLAVVGIVVLSAFTVTAGEQALVVEFGKPVRVLSEPGLHFKFPYQGVRSFDARLNVYTSPASEFLTLEKTPVVAAGTIAWRIADPGRFFRTVFDKEGGESRLGDVLSAELGAAIARSALSAFVSVEPGAYRVPALLEQVALKCKELAARDYGIEIVDLALTSFDFPKQNRARVYARMASERGRISMKYRSEGEEAGIRVRAAADGEKSRILSEALKVAQQHRAEGESEAARIYAETLGTAPEFYRFLRTMEASKTLLPKGTTLVLPADSDLFGLLHDSNHYERASAPVNAGLGPGKERATK